MYMYMYIYTYIFICIYIYISYITKHDPIGPSMHFKVHFFSKGAGVYVPRPPLNNLTGQGHRI